MIATVTLTEFLLARIAEDKERAELVHEVYGLGEVHSLTARVLAECEAKRRIVEEFAAEKHEVVDGDCWYTCAAATEGRDGGETCDYTRRGGPCDCGRDGRVNRRLAILALPYVDHPDYRQEWRA